MARRATPSVLSTDVLSVPNAQSEREFLRHAKAVWREARAKTKGTVRRGRPSEKDRIYEAITEIQKNGFLKLMDRRGKRKQSPEGTLKGKITMGKLGDAVEEQLGQKPYPHRDTIDRHVKAWCLEVLAPDISLQQWEWLVKNAPESAKNIQNSHRYLASIFGSTFRATDIEWLLQATIPHKKPPGRS